MSHRRLHHEEDDQFRDLSDVVASFPAEDRFPLFPHDALRRKFDDHGTCPRPYPHSGSTSSWWRARSPPWRRSRCWSPSTPRPRFATRWRKRVKALNERREQLKAGIVASTSKRRRNISNRNEVADKVRSLPSSFKMLQDEQVQKAQRRLMQAGVRSKDMAFVVISPRASCCRSCWAASPSCSIYVLDSFPGLGPIKRYGLVAGIVDPRLQGAGHLPQEQGRRSVARDPQGPARRARPAGDLRRGRPHRRRRRSAASPASSARPIPSWATSSP